MSHTVVGNMIGELDSSYSPTVNDPLLGADNRKGKTRTSINPKQLVILQSTYEKEPRPSRVMREELAAQTGLSAKVIQVWFQNRRSKEKKDGTKGEVGGNMLPGEAGLPTPQHSKSRIYIYSAENEY